jgi:hypothetical protein
MSEIVEAIRHFVFAGGAVSSGCAGAGSCKGCTQRSETAPHNICRTIYCVDAWNFQSANVVWITDPSHETSESVWRNSLVPECSKLLAIRHQPGAFVQVRATNMEDLGVITTHEAGMGLPPEHAGQYLPIERSDVGFDNLPGMTSIGPDDGGNGGSATGGFRGSRGLNVRHATLVAIGERYVQRSASEMNTCSSWLDLPRGGRAKVAKSTVIARPAVRNAGFFRVAASRRARIEPCDLPTFLKNSLTACSVLRRGKCCGRATSGAKCHRINTRRRPLARLLHCNVESLACPINLCADGDSRTEAVTLRNWNPSGACGIYR